MPPDYDFWKTNSLKRIIEQHILTNPNYRPRTTKMENQKTNDTRTDDEHTHQTTENENDNIRTNNTNIEYPHPDEVDTSTYMLNTSQESTETLLDYTYITDDPEQEEQQTNNTTQTLLNIFEQNKEQPTPEARTTRQKNRRNYKEDATGKTTTTSQKGKNITTKRGDASKMKIILLENTIKAMRTKATTADEERTTIITKMQEQINQRKSETARISAEWKKSKDEARYAKQELNKAKLMQKMPRRHNSKI